MGQTSPQRGKPPTKWQVYEQILRVPYYIVFSRYTNENIDRLWLRWFTVEGELIAIASEEATAAEHRATAAEQRASFAQQEAAEARQRAEKLAAKLRELNIDPDELE